MSDRSDHEPPRSALALLNRVAADDAFVGDLEEFQRRRSRIWFWRQVLGAVGMELFRHQRPLGIDLTGSRCGDVEPTPRLTHTRAHVNLSGTGTTHVGGLGLVAICLLLTIVVPQVWLWLAAMVAGGVVLGGALVLATHRRLSNMSVAGRRGFLGLAFAATVMMAGSAQENSRPKPAIPIEPIELMPPIVLTELLSDPKLPSDVADTLTELPLIEITDGCWHRAGALRAVVLAKRRKARLGDALIAQSCLDRGIPLLTRDQAHGEDEGAQSRGDNS